ncbi:hypothetical protein DY000_02014254 [Brassica cretica]|uniref:Shugoshin C-terminal domain-containing protein n=1 Tax=Brassica cretica TaxID=69181 RepID=A0ABQ7CVG7_BRACR|nr:hypothetical protein DY000_02014254 [Brassica cretica]
MPKKVREKLGPEPVARTRAREGVAEVAEIVQQEADIAELPRRSRNIVAYIICLLHSPPATCDLGTQQLITRLAAEEEIGDLRADGANDGKKQARERKLISLVDSEEESDVEITPPTRSSNPRRQTTYGTATRKPMLQSTLDGGSGSSPRACSQKNVPLKVVIRGGRRKTSTHGLSSEAQKNKGSYS